MFRGRRQHLLTRPYWLSGVRRLLGRDHDGRCREGNDRRGLVDRRGAHGRYQAPWWQQRGFAGNGSPCEASQV